jgi:hypothetical protein
MFLKNSNDHTTLVRTNNPAKKISVRGGHVIIVMMPPRIARHSEKGDDHAHRCFCFILILVSLLGLFLIPGGYHKGNFFNLPGYYVGLGPQTTFPVWVLPSAATWVVGALYFGNTQVLLGCYPYTKWLQ